MMQKIEIPLSRKKVVILLIGAFMFVVLGILLIIMPDTFVTDLYENSRLIRIVGVIGVIFFGAAGVLGLRRLLKRTIGLTIDENGIYDNTNASSVELIEWADITEVRTGQVMSTKFLLIYIENTEKYLNKVEGFKRKLLNGNMKMYGTPLSITSNTLKCSFQELEAIVENALKEYKEKL